MTTLTTESLPTTNRKQRQRATLEPLAYGVVDASVVLGLSESTVRALVRAGELRVARAGNSSQARILIPRSEIVRWLEMRLEAAPPRASISDPVGGTSPHAPDGSKEPQN